MTRRPLLAKSYDGQKRDEPPPRFALLLEHSRDVAVSCKTLFDLVGNDGLGAFGLAPERAAPLRRALVANGWAQDLGKGNSHFEQLVTSDPQIRQLLRHEHVSAMLCALHPPLRAWLSSLPEELRVLALWSAVGHHRKFHQDTKPNCGTMQVFLTHPDFARILAEMAQDVGLGPPPPLSQDVTMVDVRPPPGSIRASDALRDLRGQFCALEDRFREDLPRRELALVKGLGIAADVAASVLGRRAASSSQVGEAVRTLMATTLTSEDLKQLAWRWAWRERPAKAQEDEVQPEVLTGYPSTFVVRRFQTAVAESTSMVTLAEAGCGSGKSFAAYLWAQKWCARREADGRPFRLFFCLPTTGTTTEHYKDYALECGFDSSLAHSRASVDLSYLAETAEQEEAGEGEVSDTAKSAKAALTSARAKIDALALWSTPLVVSTTDTVLGLMANARKPVCSFPAILQSGVVFDEVHAFDEVLFGHLLLFLKHFPGLPVLLMTASLPEERRAALRAVRPDLACIPGPEAQELRRRHVIRLCVEPEPWDEIAKALANNQRVLWVCNQVERANGRWKTALARFGASADVYLYHSRYRYKDRSRLHRRVIDSFKNATRGVLLIATQVAEMSLNLSADLLVTDRAPVPSLIQRFGRHRRKEGETTPGTVLVCALPDGPGAVAPYSAEELALMEKWLETLLDREEGVNQKELTAAFKGLAQGGAVDLDAAERACGFIGYVGVEGLWRTTPGITRANGYTVSVVFPDDLKEWAKDNGAGDPPAEWFREHEVSVTVRAEMRNWKTAAGALIAQDGLEYEFDEKTLTGRGARWS